MPINFNVAPYFDDYNEDKEFLKIPSVPGVALQAREVSQIQSILQNQISRVGDHLFKEGAMVLPGQITYDPNYFYVKLVDPIGDPIVEQLDPSSATNQGNTLIIQGLTSGVQAQVLQLVGIEGSDPTTLYVKYLNSGTDKVTKVFADNEPIAIVTNGTPGASVVTTALTSSTGTGSAANIQEGVYYVYGYFVKVFSQTIILDKYDNSPSFRVGLSIQETIVKPTDDPSLNDNAQGSSNFAAPGAHRYKIHLALAKLALTSTSDTNFIELLRLNIGIKQTVVDKTDYNVLEQTFARRTYDESGDYTVNPFTLDMRQHLNDGTNGGVFSDQQGGDINKLVAILGPSKAYVRGYEIQTIDHTYVPVEKAREDNLQINSVTRAYLGNYVLVDRFYALMGFNTFAQISLCDTKVSSNGTQAGSIIGSARVRAVEFDSGTIGNAATTFPYPVYKLFLFNISLNAGSSMDNVKSYYIAGSPGSTGNVLSRLDLRNITGGTIAVGDVLTDGTNTEKVVSFNSVTGTAITETTSANPIPDSTPFTDSGITGTMFGRDKIFDLEDNISIYQLPQSVVKTIRGGTEDSPVIETTYQSRELFTTTTGGGNVSFTLPANQVFVAFSPQDYLLAVAGAVQDLASLTYTIDLSNTRFTIHSCPAGAVRFLATIQKQVAGERSKTLTDNSGSPLTASKPAGQPIPTIIALGKADAYSLVSVKEIANGTDITSRYILDNGQRDNLYDIASISLAPGQPNSTDATGLHVVFQYFTHSTNGDYFSVDSYTNFDSTANWYTNIPTYKSPASGVIYNLRDCYDFRPVIDDNGSTFTTPGDVVKVNSDIIADFRYYLSRVDKIYLDYKGNFDVIEGTPSLTPLPPPDPKDGMVLYVLTLNAFTFSDKDLKTKFIENKRYTMRDIGKLETRIANVEYYTALNLLEKETADLSIIDTTTGLDRFKNGFVVDPFTGSNIGDVFNSDYRCAIDAANRQCRPLFFSDAVGFDFNSLNSANYEYRTIKPLNDLLTCKYTEVSYIDQPYASDIENVNPYAVYSWQGTLVLDPPNDYWMDTDRRPDVLINDDSAFDSLVYLQDPSLTIGTVWNDWQTDWTGTSEQTVTNTITSAPHSVLAPADNAQSPGNQILRQSQATVTTAITTTTTQQSRTGISTTVVPKVVSQTVNNRVVNIVMQPFIRSRYVKFTAKRLKPNTIVYPFFDAVAVSGYCHALDALNPTSPTSFGPESGITALQRTLATDAVGNVTGWFLIPPVDSGVSFKAGQRTFRLTDDSQNANTATTFADATYTAQGVLETVQSTITSVRIPEVEKQTVSQSQILTNTNDRIVSTDIAYIDPLAETFLIADQPGGVFMSKVDLFFNTKDETIPVCVQIREVTNGYPSQKIVPFSDVTLAPSSVNLSDDASVATTFSFPSPVYLQNNTEYAIVIMSNSNNYNVFVAKLGDKMINSDRIISQQPYAGVLFKSQNASTWTAEQLEDLKFTLYRCQFDTNAAGATIYLTNTDLGTTELDSLPFVTSKDSSLIRVKHKNHGMPTGSHVILALPGTAIAANYNGIAATAIGGSTADADGFARRKFTISHAEMDFYMVDTGTMATASGDVGPDGTLATTNRQMDLLQPLVQQLVFSGTNIDWQMKTTSGASVDGSQTAYAKDINFTPIVVNENIPMNAPALIASTINETDLITYGGNFAFDKKSLVLQATLTTDVDNVSPVIDTKRMAAIVVANRADNGVQKNVDTFDDFKEYWLASKTDIVFTASTGVISSSSTDLSKLLANTYLGVSGTSSNNTTAPFFFKILSVNGTHSITVASTNPAVAGLTDESPGSCTLKPFFHYTDETATVGGANLSRYLIRKITLQNPATSLRIYVTSMRPAVAALDVYYKVLPVDTNLDFDSIGYTLMNLDPQIDDSAAQSPSDFKEYVWEANDIGDFVSFAVKIVFRTTDTSQVPLLKDFRGIALAT